MSRAISRLALTFALVALPAAVCAEILEVADKDGNVTHYKYTGAGGSVVFTDNLASIPAAVRKRNKIVRVGPTKKEIPAAPEPSAGLAAAVLPPVPAGSAATPEEQGAAGSFWVKGLLALVALAAGAVVVKFVSAGRKSPPRPLPARREAGGGASPPPLSPLPLPQRQPRPPARPSIETAQQPASPSPLGEDPAADPLQGLIRARDFAGAARLCEARGDFARGAELYRKAGLYPDAAEAFERVGDQLNAAENHLKAGNAARAAVCFESGGDLLQAARTFEEVGELSRAGDLYFRAGFFDEAAEIFVLRGEWARAAEAYERSGKLPEAARALEKAGGDGAKLAALQEQAGEYYASGRALVKIGQLDRALHVLQRIEPAAPDYAQASLLIGMIFFKRGLTDLAREKFAKVINYQPVGKGTLEPYYFLALCHEKAGDAAGAREIFAKILAEDYTYRDVRARLERSGA